MLCVKEIKMKNAIAIVLCFCFLMLFVAFGLGTWYVARKVNYSFSYKSMVEQTVRDMVKEECLKEEK